MGPQASGKGTIGEMLSEHFKLPLISAGDLLRNMSKGDPRYIEAKKLMDQGKLAPFELLADLLIARTDADDCHDGYIIDGWARSMKNLDFFNPGFDKVIYLTIPEDEIIKRLSNRRTCVSCGDIYNIVTVPPKVENVCDKCGGKLVQRDDDREEAIKVRLNIFKTDTIPVIHHFKKQGILLEINAEASPKEVFAHTLKALNIKDDQY